jgi:hypothetical protein
MTERPRGTNVRLACWNADGVRGRKLKLKHFLSEHVIDICFMSETHLEPGKTLSFANVSRDGPPGQGRRHSNSCPQGHRSLCCACTAPAAAGGHCHTCSVGKQTGKSRAVYLSPTQSLTECLSGDSPVLMTGDLDAKHRDWNYRLTTARGSLLYDYANRNSCLVYGPDSPTTNPYASNATPHVLDIVIVKDFVLPVHLTVAMRSGRITYSSTRSAEHFFKNHQTIPTSRERTGPYFRLASKLDCPGNPAINNEEEIGKCVEKMTSAILAVSTPKRRPYADRRPPPPAGIQNEIRLKKRFRRQWQVTRDLALKSRVNCLHRSVT